MGIKQCEECRRGKRRDPNAPWWKFWAFVECPVCCGRGLVYDATERRHAEVVRKPRFVAGAVMPTGHIVLPDDDLADAVKWLFSNQRRAAVTIYPVGKLDEYGELTPQCDLIVRVYLRDFDQKEYGLEGSALWKHGSVVRCPINGVGERLGMIVARLSRDQARRRIAAEGNA